MANKEFEKILKDRKYEYEVKDGRIIVTHSDHVDLSEIETLPENIQFNNKGWIFLGSIKALGSDIQFNNGFNIDCPKLEGKHTYLGQELEFQYIDHFTMILENKKIVGEWEVYEARFFQGTAIKNMKKRYVAKKGDYYAHGETIKDAAHGARLKIFNSKGKDMTNNAFKNIIEASGFTCICEHGYITIMHLYDIDLDELEKLPSNVHFDNNGYVSLEKIKYLPRGSEFWNTSDVFFRELERIGSDVIFNNNGHIFARSCNTISENVRFVNNGSIHLDKVETLMQRCQFYNNGDVDLREIRALPNGCDFYNNGDVSLPILQSLTSKVQFNNRGRVILGSIEALGNEIQFNNNTHIVCPKLEGKHAYLGQELEFKYVDGYTMILEQIHIEDEYEVYDARFFQGKSIEDMQKSYVARYKDYYAREDTVMQAINDVKFKATYNDKRKCD